MVRNLLCHDKAGAPTPLSSGRGKNMVKMYISGPISGTKDYVERFWEAECKLNEAGFETVNPVTLSIELEKKENRQFSWKEYIENDLEALAKCDAIYMMNGWEKSKGACVEHAFAKTNHLMIYYEENDG